MITQQTRKVPNWKCPGLDGMQGYWMKIFSSMTWKNCNTNEWHDQQRNGHPKVNRNRENNTLPKRSRQRNCRG